MSARRVLPLALCALLPAVPLAAQGTGVVTGVVVERESRVPVPAALVRLEGAERGTLTGSDGRFRLTGVPPGTRALRVEALGHATTVRTDVVVRPSGATEVELELAVAAVELTGVASPAQYFGGSPERAASVVAFSSEEIRRAPGSAGDVSRILMTLPGVAKVNDQSNALIVRGGSPLENGFYVDGMPVPNINHFPTQGSSAGAIGILDVDLVGGVELQAGGFGAEFGDRLSSVVDIALRRGSPGSPAGRAYLDFTGFGAGGEGPLPGGRGSWIASARRSYVDLLVRSVHVGATVAPRYGDAQGKLTLELGRGHVLSALALVADDHMRTDLAQALENAMLFYGRQDQVQGAAGVSWRALWNRRLLSTTSLSYAAADYDEDDRETAGDRPLLRNRSREGALTLRSVARLELRPAASLRLGGEAVRSTGRYDNAYGAHLGPLGDSVAALALARRDGGGRAAAFATLVLLPVPRLTASFGLRAEASRLGGRSRGGSLSPRLSLSYRLDEATSLRAAWGLYRQAPPLLLLSQSPENASLPDARARHLLLGVARLLTPDTRLTLEAYDKRYSRLPVDPATPPLFPLDELYYDYGVFTAHPALEAVGQADARGLEATLQKKLSGRVYGLLGAAWSRARYRGADVSWRDRVFDNRLTFSAEGGYAPAPPWLLSGRWVYAGGAPYTPLDPARSAAAGRGVLDAGRVNAARYPAYHSLNLRVDRRFDFRHADLVSYLSVWNAYGRRNVAAYYWQTDTGDVAPIRQWGRLPVFGVKLEF